MNAIQRQSLTEILTKLSDIKSEVEGIRDVEQDKYDNLSESLQSGENGNNFKTAIDALTSAINQISEVESSIE